jgi:CobQ-like glutamine amidotransferase family enzyme
MELKICHLYPDILNLYGDRGNILCMEKRLQWRGIDVTTTGVSIGQPLRAADYDLFFVGGGQDFEQEVLLKDLAGAKTAELKAAIEDEKPVLAICGGYQMLGQYYKTWDGSQCDFTGALNLYTIGSKKRMIGNYLFTCTELDNRTVVGFENHSGKTFLGDGVRPMGTVLKGYGNNGEDGMEGARYKNVFATYSHGCLLPKNPALCDCILETALTRKYGAQSKLPPLNDTLETAAHQYMEKRLREKK